MGIKHRFGKRSLKKLETCDKTLVSICHKALEYSPADFTIVWGFRNKIQQNAMVDSGVSKLRWPKSKHNHHNVTKNINFPNKIIVPDSSAIDFAPWINGGISWKDTHSFAVIAGCFFAAACEMNVRIRWGGDWDNDGQTTDQTFMDFGHIELR